jgi:GNAT superfamily N-acetyltransferase
MSVIRVATVQDAGAIARVHVESWRTTYAGIVPAAYLVSLDVGQREASWQEWLTLDVDVFVGEVDGEVVGFVGGGTIREPVEGFDAELFAIYLLREAQRHGVGWLF